MAKIPLYIGGHKRWPQSGPRRIGGYAEVPDQLEVPILAMGEWVLFYNSNNKPYSRLSGKGGVKPVYLHRVVYELLHPEEPIPPGMEIDHINPDLTLTNTAENLRLATHAQNQQNKKLQCNSTSGYMGVSWHKARQKWQVHVQDGGVLMYFGLWDDPDLAACFYDVITIQLWGDRAQTNFPRADYPDDL